MKAGPKKHNAVTITTPVPGWSSRKAIKAQVFAAITECDEFIWCGGWDGEVKEPEEDGAILIDGRPLAEHCCECGIFDRDVESACMAHNELLIDLPQRLEEFYRVEVGAPFENTLWLWPVR